MHILPWRRWWCRRWPWQSSGGGYCLGCPSVTSWLGGDTDTGGDSDDGGDAGDQGDPDHQWPLGQAPLSPQLLPSLPSLPQGKLFLQISWGTSWVSLFTWSPSHYGCSWPGHWQQYALVMMNITSLYSNCYQSLASLARELVWERMLASIKVKHWNTVLSCLLRYFATHIQQTICLLTLFKWFSNDWV